MFQRFALATGGSMQHSRDMAADPNDCGHDVLAKALDATEHLLRRPRRFQAEFHHAWIRAVAFSEMKTGGKKDAAIVATHDHLKVGERTVWNALAGVHDWPSTYGIMAEVYQIKTLSPPAPELDRERILRIFAANIRIAEESGNQQAAEFLRCQLRRFETRGRL